MLPDGDSYFGQTCRQSSKQHGWGVWASADGTRMYEGQHVQGQFLGEGRYIWDNRSVYEGEFAKGKKHGNGIMTEPNNESYSGEWKDDLKHG